MADPLPEGVHPSTAILVDDNDDLDPQSIIDREIKQIRQKLKAHASQVRHRKSVTAKPELLDPQDNFPDHELLVEQDLEQEIKFVDLTDDLPTREVETAPSPAPAGSGFSGLEDSLEEHTIDEKTVLKKNSFVELKEPIGRFRIEFLKISTLLKHRITGAVRLRGWGYARARSLNGRLARKLNEVCMIADIDEEDMRDLMTQAQIMVSVNEVLCVRSKLRTTNAPFPQHRFDLCDYYEKGKKYVEDHGPLTCRYQHLLFYRDAVKKKLGNAHEWAFQRITRDMADPRYRIGDKANLLTWRSGRGKIEGGSYRPGMTTQEDPEVIDLVDDDEDMPTKKGSKQKPDKPRKRLAGQKYTVGDVFSGAGGASCGIEQAGFKLEFAVDHWPTATNSYKLNFPDVECHTMDMDDFIKSDARKYKIDVLHLSPPCQVWSPAHTIPGQNDDGNIAALFSCTGLIKKVRPRLFTLEQTFGMLHGRFELFFNALVGGFTDHGYSVRWRIVNFATWGLSQPRKRLVMVGACPGEPLPQFPAETHSADGKGGLVRFTTARAAIANVRPGADLHDPDAMALAVPQPAWDPDTPLPRTITCSGGQNCHWTGLRDFTIREYATLQGFPVTHKFANPYRKRQIGNAFPPSMAKYLFLHLRKWLEHEDGIEAPQQVDLSREEDGPDYVHPDLKPESRQKLETKPKTEAKTFGPGQRKEDPICLDDDKSDGGDSMFVNSKDADSDVTMK